MLETATTQIKILYYQRRGNGMLNINLNNIKDKVVICEERKNDAYTKLKSFKDKNKELKAKYMAQGQSKAKIVV